VCRSFTSPRHASTPPAAQVLELASHAWRTTIFPNVLDNKTTTRSFVCVLLVDVLQDLFPGFQMPSEAILKLMYVLHHIVILGSIPKA
jgi:hypothetical protein